MRIVIAVDKMVIAMDNVLSKGFSLKLDNLYRYVFLILSNVDHVVCTRPFLSLYPIVAKFQNLKIYIQYLSQLNSQSSKNLKIYSQ